jgi:hypothetical protein
MFNLFPKWSKTESPGYTPWYEDIGFTITVDGKPYTPSELMNEFIKIKDQLKSIEKDGTVEHNNAIKLRQENVELKNELSLVEIEQEAIIVANHNMAQTLKEKNDRVILLENALDRWSTRAKSWVKLDEELKNNISELTKEVRHLRHLKTENVELIERLQKEGKSYGINFNEAKTQIIQNDYKKCAEERDEYKHQLNAANKEIEALKSKLRDYQDKYAESFSYNDMNKLQKEIDDLTLMYKERDTKLKTYNGTLLGQIAGLKEENEKLNLQVTALHKITEGGKNTIDEQKAEIKKLQDDIVDYVFEKDEQIKELQTEKYYVCNHCGYKVAHDTNYYGGCGFCKEGLMIEKEEAVQKHPMYPIHWGGYDKNIKEFVESELNNEDPAEGISELLQKAKDLTEGVEVDLDKSLDEQCDPEILKQAKEQSIEEIVDALKGIKTQGFEDYDPRDFVESEIKNEDPLEGKQVDFNAEELLRRVTEYADYSDSTKSFFNNTFSSIPKSFPNEFQEETTAENLEERFDKGENCLDYFQPYHCPCGMCKHAREENMEKSWEQVASDLALKVAKLENKVEELTIIKITSDPNYNYFLENGKWPYSAMNPDGTLKTINC